MKINLEMTIRVQKLEPIPAGDDIENKMKVIENRSRISKYIRSIEKELTDKHIIDRQILESFDRGECQIIYRGNYVSEGI